MERLIGTVKKFFPQFGYGFLTANNEDYMFDWREWHEDKDPEYGMKITFTPVKTKRGLRAKGIKEYKE